MAEFHEGGINSTVISGVIYTNVTCNNAHNVTISVSAAGGTHPLQYSADNGTTWYLNSGLFTSLPPDSYTISAKDVNAIVSVYCDNPIIITQPPAIVLSNVISKNVTCNGFLNGGITISANGGTGSLLYSIDNGYSWQSNPGFYSGLSSGAYHVQVMDSSGCFVVYSNNPVIITEPPSLLVSEVETTNVSIYGGNDSTIKITASVTIGQPVGGFEEISGGNLLTVFPNPFSEYCFFRISNKDNPLVTLSIYNGLGQKAYSLSQKFSEPGNNTILINGRNLNPGAYYYCLLNGNIILTGKIIKI